MRALVLSEGGRLSVDDRPVPEAAADQVLVRVHSAGLNRADLLQRAGRYPPPPGVPPDIPGLEFAGIVEAAGPAAIGLRPGDAVMGIVAGGAQAEYLVTPESQCVRVPETLDLVAAGGVPEAFITAHDALYTQADLHPGARVLVHAVASGVGTAAMQLACTVGATVVGTSRTKDKLERAVELGLHQAVAVERDFDAADVARRITDGGGPADVVLDLVGGPYLAVDIAAAATRARIIMVGIIAGARAELDMAALMGKRLTLRGTVLRSRPAHEKAAASHAFAGQILPLLAAGTVAPVVEEVVPLAEAERAYDLLAADTTFGKVILDLR
ncbi:MAG: zinc-binding dehydrogenase [Actinomycetota bacterium]|nr:zinc-binding dehydrogenase [Actinomycetota bacterium]